MFYTPAIIIQKVIFNHLFVLWMLYSDIDLYFAIISNILKKKILKFK